MQRSVLMIANPVAGGVDKTPLIEAARRFADERGYRFFVYETTDSDNEAALQRLAKEHRPERVLIAGGDGTIKMAADALHDCDCIFGILPSGSANGLSTDLGFPSALEDNLRIAFSDHVMEMDIVSLNGKKSLHLSDLGLNAQLIRNFEKTAMRGMLGYATKVFTTLKQTRRRFGATIEANGETRRFRAKMIVIANSTKYGTGVTINPQGRMDDGLFELVILKKLNFWIFAKIVSGRLPLGKEVEIIQTANARIKADVPVSFQIDGEFCGEERQLEVSILKGEIKVAVP